MLLMEDVYKLGRALGDVKKVADGYGRNCAAAAHGLAVLATPGALKQVEEQSLARQLQAHCAQPGDGRRGRQARQPSSGLSRPRPETGKLYGSITTQMIADSIKAKTGETVDRRQVDVQPIRNLGEYKVHIRLTLDLVPEIRVIVHRGR